MTKRDMEMLDLVKCRIQFTSPEGDYEGTVHVVCPVSKKVLVSKIFFLPKRIPMGTLSFKFREILSYTILSRADPSDLKREESTQQKYAYAPTRAQDTCFLDDCSEAGDLESYEDVCVDDLFEEEAYELKVPPMLSGRIPIDNVVIDRIDEEFHQTVKHISHQDCIGVTLEGPKIGRNGTLSWLGVSTSSCTFLFDIESLKEKAFEEGLKKILENPNIEKVFHDCRQASDCLFHQYNTRLVNVFDTQVAHLLVTMQRSQNCKFSKRVSPLDTCLRTYLEVPEEYIHKAKSFHTYEDKVVHSRLRPLKVDRKDVIIKNVIYLRLLKRELNLAMLTPFHRAVEVYLQVLQTANDKELLLDPSVPEELPQELILEGIQVVRFKEFVDVSPVVASGPPYRKLNNPIKEYADYCSKKDKSRCFSQSTIENEVVSSISGEKSIAVDTMPIHVQGGIKFHNQSKSVENGVSFRPNHVSQNVPSSRKTEKNVTPKSVVPDPSSPPKEEVCKNVESVNSANSGEKKISPFARHFNEVAKRIDQSLYDLPKLNLNADSSTSASSSDSDVEHEAHPNSYRDISIQIRESKKPQPSKIPSYFESSSDSSNSSDEDPWAILRARFASSDCSAETVKRNIRFAPA